MLVVGFPEEAQVVLVGGVVIPAAPSGGTEVELAAETDAPGRGEVVSGVVEEVEHQPQRVLLPAFLQLGHDDLVGFLPRDLLPFGIDADTPLRIGPLKRFQHAVGVVRHQGRGQALDALSPECGSTLRVAFHLDKDTILDVTDDPRVGRLTHVANGLDLLHILITQNRPPTPRSRTDGA